MTPLVIARSILSADFANLGEEIRAINEADGGINPETAGLVASAGADTFVAGSAIFKGGPEYYAANIAAIRTAAARMRRRDAA